MKNLFVSPIGIRLLALAVLLRLLIMPFFFHPDIKTYSYQSSFLKKGVVDIYSYLVNNKSRLPLKEEFVYFPLAYYTLGGYQAIVSPLLGPGFDRWLSDASGNSMSTIGVYGYLFILKLPYLILDILIAFLLIQFVKKEENKKKIFLAWLFNPFTIFLIYIYSNIDVFPVFLSLLTLLFYKKDKYFYSGLTLGLAFCFKAYPIIMIPFIILLFKDIKVAAKFIAGLLLQILVFILPLWSPAFFTSAFNSGLTTRIFSTGISLGFGESIMIVILSLTFLFYVSMKKIKKENVWIYYMFSILLILSFIHFHIQWILWVFPFLILAKVLKPSLTVPFYIFSISAFLIVWLYFDKAMTIGILSPINDVLTYSTPPSSIVQKVFDPYVLQGILHSVMAGSAIFIGYSMLKDRKI
jgi:hypothetical protein